MGRIKCDEEFCYLGSRDGIFYAINLADGNIAWKIDCSNLFNEREGTIWADDDVLLLEDKVIFTVSHRNIGYPAVIVCAGKPDGTIIWKAEHPSQFCGSITYSEEMILSVTEDRMILKINMKSGKSSTFDILPEMNRGEFAGIRLDEKHLYIAGADTHVWRIALHQILNETSKTVNTTGFSWNQFGKAMRRLTEYWPVCYL